MALQHRFLLVLSTLLWTWSAWGQVAGLNQQQGVVSVNGTADMTKAPEVIRIIFKQYGKGADQEAAKTALVAVEKKLMTRLGDAGATVIVSHAGVAMPSPNLLSRVRNLNSMIMNRRGGVVDNNAEKNVTYLERNLVVDLKPKEKGKEAMALLGELQERLRKEFMEVSGLNDALPKDDPNDNNRADLVMYRSDASQFGNEVRFQIAARITREDRIKLYVEAIRRAKSVAGDLAEAAEMKVGGIQSLNSSFSSSSSITSYGSGMRAMTANGEFAKFPITLKEDGSESLAVRELNMMGYQNMMLEPLTYQVSVSASFRLEPAK